MIASQAFNIGLEQQLQQSTLAGRRGGFRAHVVVHVDEVAHLLTMMASQAANAVLEPQVQQNLLADGLQGDGPGNLDRV